jgi:hypothetical protein
MGEIGRATFRAAPKEQFALDTLRHKNRCGLRLWRVKAGFAVFPPKDEVVVVLRPMHNLR